MKLILLRHGETEEEKKGIILGRLPGTLSMEGKEQAEKVAETIKLSKITPEIIISSDLVRAAHYATIIGYELSLKIELDPLARERSAGEVEGMAQDKIDWEEYERIAKLSRKHVGGESFEDVRIRAKEFLKKIGTLPFQTAILVSHSVFLAMLTMEACDWNLDDALNYDFRNPLVIDTNKKGAESLPLH
jgi:broad specificity phosphatase PhoE